MKLNEEEKKIFEDFLSFLQLHPELKKWELSSEPVLSLPDLEIDPSQRLVRCNQKEVGLTAKEYSLLCLLTVNNGRVLIYSQIYEKVSIHSSYLMRFLYRRFVWQKKIRLMLPWMGCFLQKI